jgi:hypothetical protein
MVQFDILTITFELYQFYHRDYTGHYISIQLLEENDSQIKTLANVGKNSRRAEDKCNIVLVPDDG